MQSSLFSTVQWTVSTLTKHIREVLESDVQLADLWVEGEVSNVSRPASGHLYFTLKDSGAALRCVMWRSNVARLEFALQDGIAVAVHGRVGVYDAGGQYQLYVERLIPAGEGALYQEFLRLKASLEAEGLFAAERKRVIPVLPRQIGIVTSASGAALRDVLNILRRRLPIAEITLAPSAVQGEEAPRELAQALDRLNKLQPRPDVILLVRGGGSIEDLWAFNDPGVVRAVAASAVPIVCGVGHETDFTLADFAADLRAPTPTAAAELVTPTTATDLSDRTSTLGSRLSELMATWILRAREATESARRELAYVGPIRRIESARQRTDEVGRRLLIAATHRLALQRSSFAGWDRRLTALSPLEVLGRGYAIVTRKSDSVVVRKVNQARGGIRVRVSDGTFDADVEPGSD